ncbi:MAG: hypothetical protein ACKOBF_09395 [Limnohabitans sp.]
MDKLIVYVDDAAHALGVLQPLLARGAGQPPRQWIVVACAPRVPHHVSNWVTHSARESWRGKWSDKLFAQLVPVLQRQGDEVITCAGKNNLTIQSESLQRIHGEARIIDARRPKFSAGQQSLSTRPAGPGALLSLGLSLLGSGMLVAVE